MTDTTPTPLDGPAPALGFGDAVATCLEKYATFSGRASRSEFWYFVVAAILANLVASIATSLVFANEPEVGAIMSLLISFVILIPVVAAGVRRLHDTGRSGWWYLLAAIPIANIALLIMLAEAPRPTAPTNVASTWQPPGPTDPTGRPAPPSDTATASGWEPVPHRPHQGAFVALWLAVGVLVLSNVAAWVMVGTLWQERADTQATAGGQSLASELRAADRRIESLEDDLAEAKFGSNLTALRVQAFVECVNTYMRVVGDSGGGPYRYNFCR